MRSTSYSRDELRTICRAKGWITSKDGKFSKERGMDFLAKQGIAMEEVFTLIRQLRAASRGIAAPSQTVVQQTVEGIGQDQLNEAVERIVAERLKGASLDVDSGMIGKMIAEAVAKAQPHRVVLNGSDDKKPVVLKHRTHPLFEKVLRLVKAGLNVLLVGPAGCGKTTLAHHIATALKREFGMLSCTAGASESQLVGWLLPVGKDKGSFTYVASEFIRLYEQGNAVFLFDEFDAGDPNMLLVINSALANGSLHVPQRHERPLIERGKNMAMIAAANTFGTGADTMYAGRNQLDAATLDRFYPISMAYDTALEAEVMGLSPKGIKSWGAAPAPSEEELHGLGDWIKNLREQVVQHRLRRVVSTRTFQKAFTARRVGVPLAEVKQDILSGWTRDEMIKVGVAS